MLEKDSQKLEIEIINYNNSLSSSSDLEEQKTSGNHSGTYHKSGVGMGEPTRKQVCIHSSTGAILLFALLRLLCLGWPMLHFLCMRPFTSLPQSN